MTQPTLYLRPNDPLLASLPAATMPVSLLVGIEVVLTEWLPRTVKDKDGRNVELVGVLVDRAGYERWVTDLTGTIVPRVTLLVGDVVTEPKTEDT